MKRVAAFFDIDGTIYRDSLMIEHFKQLMKTELIPKALWHAHTEEVYMNYDKRQGNYDDYLLEVANNYVEAITGLDREAIDFTSRLVIEQKAERVYRYTRSQIEWHKEQGHLVIFISGSPDFLVEKMAEKYDAFDYRGSHYVFKDGKFTGRVRPMWDSEHKNLAISHFVDAYNIDLSESFAYGDTNGDFTMLSQVGHPVAINPTKELLMSIRNDEKLAKIATISIERKDIVYHVDPMVCMVD